MGNAKYLHQTVNFEGKVYTYHEAAEILDISVHAFAKRITTGWTVQEAMTIPRGKYRVKRTGINGKRRETVFEGLKPIEALSMRWIRGSK